MAPMHVDVPAEQVELGERDVLGAEHGSACRKLPSAAGIDGIRKKKTITTPCSVKNLL
jgi:hypothetical protein